MDQWSDKYGGHRTYHSCSSSHNDDRNRCADLVLSSACGDSSCDAPQNGMENDGADRNHWIRFAMELVDNRFLD